MKIKKFIYRVIDNNLFVGKLYLQMFNKINDKMHACKLHGVKIRNNVINIQGRNNTLTSGKDCSIQNNVTE